MDPDSRYLRYLLHEIETDLEEKRRDKDAFRPPSESNYLSSSQLRYLLTGRTGSYSEKKQKRRISKDVSNIQIRFQRLINDISLLEYGGYLEDTDEIWDQLSEIEGHARSFADQRSILSNSEVNQPEILFGYELGTVFSMLIGQAHKNHRAADFLWGFVLAHCATINGQLEDEEHNVEAVFDALQDRREDHFEDAISHRVDGDRCSNFPDNTIEETLDEILRQLELQLPEKVRSAIIASTREKATVSDEHEESLVAEYLELYLQNEPLKEMNHVYSVLCEEWEIISQSHANDVEASDALELIWKEDSPKSIDIAKILRKRYNTSIEPKTVTEVLNKFSEEGKNRGDVVATKYNHGSILEHDGNKWWLTNYGHLLCHFSFEKDGGFDSLYEIYRRKTTFEKKVAELYHHIVEKDRDEPRLLGIKDPNSGDQPYEKYLYVFEENKEPAWLYGIYQGYSNFVKELEKVENEYEILKKGAEEILDDNPF